jgi:GMP synthase (glutamine-hydrolysing)
MQETILILDFGSQYTQLIARRVRELDVYCEIHPYNNIPEISKNIIGVILSGSPFSVQDENAPDPDLSQIKGKLPLLAICYGAQYLAQKYGGQVVASEHREYGRANLTMINHSTPLFDGIKEGSQVWMSHGDTIKTLPSNYTLIGSSKDVVNAAFKINEEDTYAIQFHPEVYHSTDGLKLLKNFIVDIAKCKQDWTPASYIETTVEELKLKIGSDKVILGLSGGVDSTVAATLLSRAIGKNLYCIFVDNGLLRKNEFEEVLDQYKGLGLNVKGVNAKSRFYEELKGEKDPEGKRIIIGRVFIEVFDDESQLIEDA